MDYPRTQTHMYSSGQCRLPVCSICQALHASNFYLFHISLSSKPTLVLPSPGASDYVLKWVHFSPWESVPLRALLHSASLLLGLWRSIPDTGSFMTAGAVSYGFPCRIHLGKYLLMNCVQHSAQNRVLVRRSVGQTSEVRIWTLWPARCGIFGRLLHLSQCHFLQRQSRDSDNTYPLGIAWALK